MDFTSFCNEEEIEFYQKTFGVSEPWNIPTDKLEDCNYKDLRLLDDKFAEMNNEIENLKEKDEKGLEEFHDLVMENEKLENEVDDLMKKMGEMRGEWAKDHHKVKRLEYDLREMVKLKDQSK
jgi:predicted nuclease with TOPRIM domain